MKFHFAPPPYYTDIGSVHLVGSFNGWNCAQTPMTEESGVWKTSLDLPEGNYPYKYLINGLEWLHDPAAARFEQNEVGSLNSIAQTNPEKQGAFFPLRPTLNQEITISGVKPGKLVWSVNGWQESDAGYLCKNIQNLDVNVQEMVYSEKTGLYETSIGPFNRRKIPQVIAYSFIYDDGAAEEKVWWIPLDMEIGGKCRIESFKSKALAGDHPYKIYLPENYESGKCPLLLMLHGYGGSHLADWTQADTVKMLADRHGVITVWVDGNVLAWGESIPGWYINSPAVPSAQMEDYIIKELIPHVESRYRCSGQRFIGGISMGGFGAFHLAASYPGTFRAAAAFSAIYSLYKYRRIDALKKLVGGDDKWSKGMYNVIRQIRRSSGTDYYFIVGDEERGALYDNFSLKLAMEKYAVPNEFRIYQGDHTNNFWRVYLQEMMEFFARRIES